jgi:hypothetical protein
MPSFKPSLVTPSEIQPRYKDGQVFVGPPMPGEPFILHRPLLRHPLRRGHRLHEQERVELEKAGLLDD